jgi:bacteriocin-like protein
MLMKYKDFKTMTQAEMKKIVGGNEEEELDSCGTCPSSSGGVLNLRVQKVMVCASSLQTVTMQ